MILCRLLINSIRHLVRVVGERRGKKEEERRIAVRIDISSLSKCEKRQARRRKTANIANHGRFAGRILVNYSANKISLVEMRKSRGEICKQRKGNRFVGGGGEEKGKIH